MLERERERGTPSAGSVVAWDWFWAWANSIRWPKMQEAQKAKTRRGDDPSMTSIFLYEIDWLTK